MNEVNIMTKIISNGKTKTFYTKCANCATEFEYQLSDVKEEAEEIPFLTGKSVKCPVCESEEIATLLTKEEYQKITPWNYGYNGCSV